MKKNLLIVLLLFIIVIESITLINFYVLSFSNNNYFKKVDNLEQKYVGLVFWASVIWKDKPSDILKDRLDVAFEAYEKNKIERIIVSWDNSISHYNEPIVMQKYLINLWVDVDDIYLDYAWFDTYDSIYRAKEIFWVDEIILFTQDFHLKRAMYISEKLWIKTYWVETNLHKYVFDDYNNRREILARVKAFLDVEIFKSKPKFLGDSIEIISDEKINKAKKEILDK
jgi:SanA protein